MSTSSDKKFAIKRGHVASIMFALLEDHVTRTDWLGWAVCFWVDKNYGSFSRLIKEIVPKEKAYMVLGVLRIAEYMSIACDIEFVDEKGETPVGVASGLLYVQLTPHIGSDAAESISNAFVTNPGRNVEHCIATSVPLEKRKVVRDILERINELVGDGNPEKKVQ